MSGAGSPQPQFVYRARLERVVDGDTIVLEIALGCFVSASKAVRLLGINTPEKIGPSRAAGLAAGQAARDWCAAAAIANPDTAWPLVVLTELDKDDRYGRLLGTVYARGNPVSLNQALLVAGWAVPYDGKGPRP